MGIVPFHKNSWLRYPNATPFLNCGLKFLQQIGNSFYYFKWQTDAPLYCPTGHSKLFKT